MYFRDCKTISVFERKVPLTLEFRFEFVPLGNEGVKK
jgi:hypothetical protein